LSKCPICIEGTLIWQNDFTFEDYCLDGEGLVSVWCCSECEALVEIKIEDKVAEEKEMTKTRGFEVVSKEFRKHPEVEIQTPRRADPDACASDIYSPVALVLQPNEQKLIWTDIKAYMQKGEVLLANVRSSHGEPRVRLANTQGWVDGSYYENPKNDGNIGVYISNEGTQPYEIKVGDRIAQLMFIPYLTPDNDNPLKDKRDGGFGSSGKN
jgi:dUTP pyrophosphatase